MLPHPNFVSGKAFHAPLNERQTFRMAWHTPRETRLPQINHNPKNALGKRRSNEKTNLSPRYCSTIHSMDGRGRANMFRTAKRQGFVRRLARHEGGASAVEFALVATPFFMLLFAVFDIALIYLGTSALENGVNSAARLIRTGQAQAAGMTQTQFRDMVCTRIAPLLSCNESLYIDVRRFNSFGGVSTPSPLDGTGNFDANNQFQPGTAGEIVVVRAYYAWPKLTPTGQVFATMANQKHMLTASTAFRNEPF